jgi:hypothetical protein
MTEGQGTDFSLDSFSPCSKEKRKVMPANSADVMPRHLSFFFFASPKSNLSKRWIAIQRFSRLFLLALEILQGGDPRLMPSSIYRHFRPRSPDHLPHSKDGRIERYGEQPERLHGSCSFDAPTPMM